MSEWLGVVRWKILKRDLSQSVPLAQNFQDMQGILKGVKRMQGRRFRTLCKRVEARLVVTRTLAPDKLDENPGSEVSHDRKYTVASALSSVVYWTEYFIEGEITYHE